MSRLPLARLRACFRWGWPLIVWLLAMSLGLAVFVSLAKNVLEQEAFGFDQAILTALASVASPALTSVMLLITDSASDLFLVGLLLALTVLWWRRYRADWIALAVALTGAFLLNLIAKQFFGRARPELFAHLQDVDGYSFPSGHSQAAMAFYPVLAYLIARRVDPKWRLPIFLASGAWVVLVGLSRNYLAVHYPSDVLAAFAVTLPWVLAVIFVHQCYAPRLET